MRCLLLFLWFNNYVDDSQSKQTVKNENDKVSRCMRQFLLFVIPFDVSSFDMLSSLSFLYFLSGKIKCNFLSLPYVDRLIMHQGGDY